MFYPYYYPYYYPYMGGWGGWGGRSLAFPFLTGFLLGELFW